MAGRLTPNLFGNRAPRASLSEYRETLLNIYLLSNLGTYISFLAKNPFQLRRQVSQPALLKLRWGSSSPYQGYLSAFDSICETPS